MPHPPKTYDYLIAGSGFTGSITALCLNSAGFDVCLVEKDEHPRFAIGESSTPIADMILRDLADTYNLPQLRKLSRYGSWQTHYPNVTCGLKRGFSYYKHSKHQRFQSDSDHSMELLVAASVDDNNSDTQWYRPDTDALFVQMVKDAGINYFDHTEIASVDRTEIGTWSVRANQDRNSIILEAGFIIDATGSPQFSGQFFGTTSSADEFHTSSRAIYSHFENIPEWQPYLENLGAKTADYPYNPDHSALHHLIEPGWLWMLRFNNGLLSAGFVIDGSEPNSKPAADEWQRILSDYPSLENLFNSGKIADMPGKLVKTGRLQRKLNTMYGNGWAALHHTAGFVDPLHSTGIAHSLSGVEKLVSILTETHDHSDKRNNRLSDYEDAFFRELKLIDLLVAGCYKSRRNFDLFTAFTMLYFICSINYEQSRLAGHVPDHFLSAGNPELNSVMRRCFAELTSLLEQSPLPNRDKVERFKDFVIQQIKPFNSVGLMDPSKKNMYEHTAAVL
ncbi:NAD(P)/FAD-dependent oxidoreductase [Rhodohalobacter sp. 8-1]|uniref:NAD(P)/FAD-dependent oxidoreductase n=1 Tax=Rhodohalobacter sp. 8-1 TaxID=3131972 RepID=UPI0030EE1EE6